MSEKGISTRVWPNATLLENVSPIRNILENAGENVLERIVDLSKELNIRVRIMEGRNKFKSVISDARMHSSATQETIDTFGEMLHELSIKDATQAILSEDASIEAYVLSFLQAAQIQYQKGMTRDSMDAVLGGTHPVFSPLSMPGREMNGMRNHEFLLRNSYMNYLRLPGIWKPIDYDLLHSRYLYRFTHSKDPSDFVSQEVYSYRTGKKSKENLLENKNILTLGPGRGRDEAFMLQSGAANVYMIEGSEYMLGRLKKIKDELPRKLQKRFHVPEKTENMLEDLKTLPEKMKFDTIYSHSSIHYFDDETLQQLLGDIQSCLKPNGHFVFAVKAPGAVLDGNGILMTEEKSTLTSSLGESHDEERLHSRMWMNYDGQLRVFRDKGSWMKLLQQYFAVPRVTEHSVERYETESQRAQTFYYFICSHLPTHGDHKKQRS